MDSNALAAHAFPAQVVGSAAFTGKDRAVTLPVLLAAQVELRPQAPALVWEGGSRTCAETDARSTAVARGLRKAGVAPNDPVGLYFESSDEFVVAAIGVWKAGGAYLPIDPAYPVERATYILADSGAHLPTSGDRRNHYGQV
jgi:non-ribosomal peptide synthetase component F